MTGIPQSIVNSVIVDNSNSSAQINSNIEFNEFFCSSSKDDDQWNHVYTII